MLQFHKRDKVKWIVNRPGVEESMLTAYFDANKHHEEARRILYWDFSGYFTWQCDGKFWQKRKNSIFQVGRVISGHPAEGEHYFLRVLLNNVAGATSYEHLRTVDGMLLPSLAAFGWSENFRPAGWFGLFSSQCYSASFSRYSISLSQNQPL